MRQQAIEDGREPDGPRVGSSTSSLCRHECIGRPRVLLAEDHDDTRDALRMLLEMNGYEVLAARDGEEALRLATEARPDVVITDYDMPLADGAEVARQLRSMRPATDTVPILLLTALHQGMVEPAMEAGANAYISKPVDFQTLSAALRTFVNR